VELQPLKTSRVSTNHAGVLQRDGKTYLIKRYTGEHPRERLACEKLSLSLWAGAGFKVPALSALEIPELRGTDYLVLEFLNGPTLQDLLKNTAVGLDEKWELLSRILIDNCRRQCRAIAQQEPRLLHPDPNSSNILCVGREYYFIDFETTVDLGIAHLPELARRAAVAYGDHTDTLSLIIARTCSRPFQLFHRWQDRRRKQRQPGEVTKYDIVDALATILRTAHR
jgi:tRNA A-37 threonylcarbamoyl transferase component Bud32